MSETERWLKQAELSAAIKAAWKAGLEVEDKYPVNGPMLVTEPRVFFYDRTEKIWKATLLSIWLEDRQYTRFYTFLAELPRFVTLR